MNPTNLLRVDQISSTKNNPGLLPVSKATIWRWVKEGNFPKPFKLASMTTVWDKADILKWLEDQKAQSNDNTL